MRFFLLMLLYGVLAVVIESTWLANLPTQSLRFDFIIVAIAALSFSVEWQRALPVVITYGVLVDILSAAPFGMSIFCYVIIYLVFRMIVSKISFQAGPALLFWVAVASLMEKLLSIFVSVVSNSNIAMVRAILRAMPAQVLLDSVLGLGMVPFLDWYRELSWEKITRPKGLVMK
jgi:hypothetical protein